MPMVRRAADHAGRPVVRGVYCNQSGSFASQPELSKKGGGRLHYAWGQDMNDQVRAYVYGYEYEPDAWPTEADMDNLPASLRHGEGCPIGAELPCEAEFDETVFCDMDGVFVGWTEPGGILPGSGGARAERVGLCRIWPERFGPIRDYERAVLEEAADGQYDRVWQAAGGDPDDRNNRWRTNDLVKAAVDGRWDNTFGKHSDRAFRWHDPWTGGPPSPESLSILVRIRRGHIQAMRKKAEAELFG